jgi:ribosomal protein S18 acetylase RimI-like enzyme
VFFKIQQPETKEDFKHYYYLRWKLLRAPWQQPQGSEADEIEDQCFHVMAVTAINNKAANSNNKVIAVARLQFNSNTEAQIRYMAVEKTYQRKGIGRALINAMETQAEKSGCEKVILDAREPAVDFYKKLGYKISKKSYLLFDEIQHFCMIKVLSRNV